MKLKNTLTSPSISLGKRLLISHSVFFFQKIVHFDLKGAPPTLNYYREMFPLLKEMEVNGILMEYEDMFPYRSELSVLKRTISYSETVLEAILQVNFSFH